MRVEIEAYQSHMNELIDWFGENKFPLVEIRRDNEGSYYLGSKYLTEEALGMSDIDFVTMDGEGPSACSFLIREADKVLAQIKFPTTMIIDGVGSIPEDEIEL